MGSIDHRSLDELLYTQRLADNDDIVRSKTLRKLKKFLNLKSQQQQGFSYEDLIKIWKGLYYCMYMADKPLIQEALAEDVSNLIHEFSSNSQKLVFFKVALDTFAREWAGIDKFRMDKFLMLFTRVLRQCLFHLLNICWNIGEVKQMSEILESSIICPYDETNRKPMGLKLHLAKTILQELAKVGKESVPDKVLVTLLYPFLKVMAVSSQPFYIKTIQDYILDSLIKQSKLGIEHQEDLTLNELEIVKPDEDESEEEDEDFVMDPRAGGVDVYLPLLKPNYKLIAKVVQSVASIPQVPRKNRQLLHRHANRFLKMAKDVYPLPNPVANYDVEKLNRKKLLRNAVNKRLNCEFSDKPSGKRKLEDSEAAVGVKKRRRKNLTLTEKKPKISKEEVKKNVRKASKKKSTLKAKLNNPDKVLESVLKSVAKAQGDNSDSTKRAVSTKSQGEISDSTNQGVSSDKRKFEVTPKKPLKKTTLSSRNKGWQVKKLVSKSAQPHEHVMTKNPPKRKVAETISKTLSTEDIPVPLSVETRMQSSKTKKHRESLKSEATEKRKKITTDQIQRKGTKTGKTMLHGVDPKNCQTQDKEAISLPIPRTTSLLEVPKHKPKNEKPQASLKLKSVGKRKKIVNGSPLNNSNDVSIQKRSESETTTKTRNQNVSGNSQNDPWKEDLKEGETEIVVMSKKYAKKMPKRLNMVIEKTPKMNTKGKTLKINLRKNEEHDWKDYNKVLKSCPGNTVFGKQETTWFSFETSFTTQFNQKEMLPCQNKIHQVKIQSLAYVSRIILSRGDDKYFTSILLNHL